VWEPCVRATNRFCLPKSRRSRTRSEAVDFFCHGKAFISAPSCFRHSARNQAVAAWSAFGPVGIPPENVFGVPPVRHSDHLPSRSTAFLTISDHRVSRNTAPSTPAGNISQFVWTTVGAAVSAGCLVQVADQWACV